MRRYQTQKVGYILYIGDNVHILYYWTSITAQMLRFEKRQNAPFLRCPSEAVALWDSQPINTSQTDSSGAHCRGRSVSGSR